MVSNLETNKWNKFLESPKILEFWKEKNISMVTYHIFSRFLYILWPRLYFSFFISWFVIVCIFWYKYFSFFEHSGWDLGLKISKANVKHEIIMIIIDHSTKPLTQKIMFNHKKQKLNADMNIKKNNQVYWIYT